MELIRTGPKPERKYHEITYSTKQLLLHLMLSRTVWELTMKTCPMKLQYVERENSKNKTQVFCRGFDVCGTCMVWVPHITPLLCSKPLYPFREAYMFSKYYTVCQKRQCPQTLASVWVRGLPDGPPCATFAAQFVWSTEHCHGEILNTLLW